MKKHFLVAAVLLALGASHLAAQGANITVAKNTDFSKFHTYKWVGIENAQHLDDLTAEQLLATLDVELAKKYLTKSTTDTADLFIGYQIAGGKNKLSNHFGLGGSYGSAAGATAGAGGATTTVVHTGQLVLDMYDAASKELLWRGVIGNAIDANAKPDKKQRKMDKAVETLLKGFPPPKKL